jgi:hypothetical protein
MNQEVKQNLNLPEGITAIVVENVAEIKKLQALIQGHNQKINDVMVGFCLSRGINLDLETIRFSEDYKTLKVYDLPKQEGVSNEPKESVKPAKSKVKKMTDSVS